ncbi:MAG: TonB-dependent receptor plug domain-containing protein [Alphaproteobacteria bacterium]|nr:TonB-dependent receptor plug domain-containing protein [Alphaproteobacteria bacterium]
MRGVGARSVRRSAALGAASAIALSAVGIAHADVTDEIVVTARKREESLQDIPVAGTVIGQDMVDNFVLESVKDIIQFVPGAINSSSDQGNDYSEAIVIRGTGAEGQEQQSASTSLNRNGIFIGNGTFFGRTYTRFDNFDAERVEVFRGPQAALFGRNAVGGAVNIVTAKPKFENEGRLKTTYEVEREQKAIEVIQNFALSDKVAVRVGGLWDKREGGFIIQDDDPDFPLAGQKLDFSNYKGVRVQVRARPNDDLDVTVTAEFSEQETPGAGVSTRNVSRDQGLGKFDRHGFTLEDAETDVETANIFLQGSYDRSYGTWNATLYYQNRQAESLDDFDALQATSMLDAPAGNQGVTRADHFERYAAEVYLASNASAPDNVKWLIGADFQGYEDNYTQFVETLVPGLGQPGATIASDLSWVIPAQATNLPCANATGPQTYLLTVGIGRAAMPNCRQVVSFVGTMLTGATYTEGYWIEGYLALSQINFFNYTRRSKSYSTFGSVDYKPFNDITLSGEIRLIDTKIEGIKDTDTFRIGAVYSGGAIATTAIGTLVPAQTVITGPGSPTADGNPSTPEFELPTTGTSTGAVQTAYGSGGCIRYGGAAGTNAGSTVACAGTPTIQSFVLTAINEEPDQEEFKVTPVGSITYDVAPGEIAYFRVGAGFRPGNIELRTVPTLKYDSETVVSYEVGYKGQAELWGGRQFFDTAFYFNHHSNYQQQTFDIHPQTGNFITAITNEGDAYSLGLEASFRGGWQAFGGRLTTTGSFSTSYGKLTTGSKGGPLTSITGTTVIVESTKGNRMPGTKDYQIALTGSYVAPVPNTAFNYFGNVSFTAEGGGYRDPFNNQEAANFEQFGGSLGLRGDNWYTQLFVRNAFNEIHEVYRTANGNLVGYSEPRTWGAVVGFSW